MSAIATIDNPVSAAVLSSVLLDGDLSKLNAAQLVEYMGKVCATLGLNPLTKPFEFLRLNGKLVMYAKRDCTEQLRKIHGVSIEIRSREEVAGCYVVTAHASTKDGRTDESLGAVPIEGLKGEALANAMMKCETKAKRRVTLSICGLGILDEIEVASIAGAERHVDAAVREEPRQAPAPAAAPKPAPKAAAAPTARVSPTATAENPNGIGKAECDTLAIALKQELAPLKLEGLASMVWFGDCKGFVSRHATLKQAIADVRHYRSAVGDDQAASMLEDIAQEFGYPAASRSQSAESKELCAQFVRALRQGANGETPTGHVEPVAAAAHPDQPPF